MNDFRAYQSNALYHHGVEGMHWGQRNGPPYPLQSFQRKAGNAVAKGKKALASATTATGKALVKVYKNQAERTKARIAAERARRKEEAADLERRKADAARRARLLKMAKKHPELLSYQELSDLNNRANQESNFNRNYNTKKATTVTKQAGSSLLRDVVNPGTVALGKAAVMAVVGHGSFRKIASAQLDKAYNGEKKDPGLGKQPKGTAKKK